MQDQFARFALGFPAAPAAAPAAAPVPAAAFAAAFAAAAAAPPPPPPLRLPLGWPFASASGATGATARAKRTAKRVTFADGLGTDADPPVRLACAGVGVLTWARAVEGGAGGAGGALRDAMDLSTDRHVRNKYQRMETGSAALAHNEEMLLRLADLRLAGMERSDSATSEELEL